MLLLCVSAALLPGCSTGNAPCGAMTHDECAKVIVRHEAFPGEFSMLKNTVRAEYRRGKTGVWIGSDIFRIETEVDNNKKTNSPAKIPGPSLNCATPAAVEKAKHEILLLLGNVFSDELSRKPGMINYELSQIAFQQEMKGILQQGEVVKQEHIDGRCRIVFQIKMTCLQNLVYAKDVTVRGYK